MSQIYPLFASPLIVNIINLITYKLEKDIKSFDKILIKPAKTIKSAYRALQAQLIGSFNSDAQLYQQSGGNNSFLESFVVIPYVNQWKMGNAAQQIDQAETADILTTIPVPVE